MMDKTQLRTVWGLVKQTNKHLGIDTPKDVADELARLDELTRSGEGLAGFDTATLGEALAQCLAKGGDPYTDKAVTRQAVALTLGGKVSGALAAHAHNLRAALLVEHAPTWLAGYSQAVAGAQQRIEDALAVAPLRAITDPDGLATVRAEAASPVALARDAVRDAEQAVSTWRALSNAVGLANLHAGHTAIAAADLSASQYDSLNRMERTKVAAVVAAGHALNLPADPNEVTERIARLEPQRQQARDVADEARRARMKQLPEDFTMTLRR